MEKQTDEKVSISMVQETKAKYPDFKSCSFDKGFYSPENKEELKRLLEKLILPKKGKLSLARAHNLIEVFGGRFWDQGIIPLWQFIVP